MPERISFRNVEGYPGYRVKDDGSVWTLWNRVHFGGRVGSKLVKGIRWRKMHLFQWTKSPYYLTVALWKDGKSNRVTVHKIVATAFLGPRQEGYQCRHLDGNGTNNSVNNLCWGTCQENMHDKVLHGTDSKGSRNGAAKLTESDIPKIFALKRQGLFDHQIAPMFNVGRTTITHVLNRQVWGHVPIDS